MEKEKEKKTEKKEHLTVQKSRPFDYDDALIITCLLIGILVGVITIITGFYICDTLIQWILCFVFTSTMTGYGLYKILTYFIQKY